MSLDFAILGCDGSPVREVRIGLEDHAQLMVFAEGLPLLSRLEDYYHDVDFGPTEVPVLFKELIQLQSVVGDSSRISRLLNDLISLVREALSKSSPVVAIAD